MEVELSGFDVVVVCMALHHVTDAGRLLARLKECLKPGGVCVVVDGVCRHQCKLQVKMRRLLTYGMF